MWHAGIWDKKKNFLGFIVDSHINKSVVRDRAGEWMEENSNNK